MRTKKIVSDVLPEADLFGNTSQAAPMVAEPCIETAADHDLGNRPVGLEVHIQRTREALSELALASTRFGMEAAYHKPEHREVINHRYGNKAPVVVERAAENGVNALKRARAAFYGAYFGTWAATDELITAVAAEPAAQDAWEDFYNTYGNAAGAPARAATEAQLKTNLATFQEANLIPRYTQE